jgi:molybdenum cofactor biosynthesis enzyme
MLDDWKEMLETEIADVEELEEEARTLLAELRDSLDKEQLNQVESMITRGGELINIVRVGNGVHNKKYAITIIDGAFGNFEDSIDLLEASR